MATDYNGTPLYMFANMLNNALGVLTWQSDSSSTSPTVQDEYFWALDADSNLVVAYTLPPYTYTYMAYVVTTSTGTLWPQLNTKAVITSAINSGAQVAPIKGCIDSDTGDLTLNAAGRKNILYCGAQLWMGYGNGEDINRGSPCVRMYPTIVAA